MGTNSSSCILAQERESNLSWLAIEGGIDTHRRKLATRPDRRQPRQILTRNSIARIDLQRSAQSLLGGIELVLHQEADPEIPLRLRQHIAQGNALAKE